MLRYLIKISDLPVYYVMHLRKVCKSKKYRIKCHVKVVTKPSVVISTDIVDPFNEGPQAQPADASHPQTFTVSEYFANAFLRPSKKRGNAIIGFHQLTSFVSYVVQVKAGKVLLARCILQAQKNGKMCWRTVQDLFLSALDLSSLPCTRSILLHSTYQVCFALAYFTYSFSL